jgi:4-amino-4-deoxy-L-arabinose transferase-like glycosyltransferase
MSASSVSADPIEGRPHRGLRARYGILVLGLLVLMAAEIVLATRQESQTFDEANHLYAGYEYWKHGDFGHNPEHPPLAKLIAASSLLPLHLKEPAASPSPYFKAQDFLSAPEFLYNADADSLLARGRAMLIVFSLGLALAIFAAGWEMFGVEAGLLAMVLFTFEPILLANGGLITTDMTVSCMFFCSVYAFYRYVKRPTGARLTVCAIAVGLTIAAKHSGVFVFPILGAIAVAELLLRWRKTAADGSRAASMQNMRSAAISLALGLAVIAVVSYGMLWAFYGFRYAARPGGLPMSPTLDVYSAAIHNKLEAGMIGFCARHHLLPESYLYGWADILQIPGLRITFLLGKLYMGGRWFLFPGLILVKSTITLLVLLALVPKAGVWRRSREFMFLAIPAVSFLLIAMLSGMNAESRYILPIYPFCIVLAGAAAWRMAQRSRGWAIAVAALVVFAAASSLHAFPNYLAYSNEAFGGPSKSYRQISNSNGDWGQGLKWVKRYLDANQISDCWFDYNIPFVDPKYYGIGCKPLASSWVKLGLATPTPVPAVISGTVLVSASELDGHLWGPDALNPYDQFSHLRPDAVPGNVVLVYHGTFDVPLASAYSHLGAAGVLTREKKMTEAVAEAEEAARLAPDSAQIQAGLGRTLKVAGRTEEAQQANATALRLARTVHPEFQELLIHQIERANPTGTR